MMKFFKGSLIIILFFLLTSFTLLKEYDATLYMLPKNSEKLSAVNKKIYAEDNAEFCTKLIDELISAQKHNYIPSVPDDTKIFTKDSDAVIDLPPIFLSNELATIYSLVNSVTSTGDIITVEFTVNGEKITDFFKKTSITETFIPDYNI